MKHRWKDRDGYIAFLTRRIREAYQDERAACKKGYRTKETISLSWEDLILNTLDSEFCYRVEWMTDHAYERIKKDVTKRLDWRLLGHLVMVK